jgi:hypothetical protein
MRVELLWWEGCPSYPNALEQLRTVLAEEGADPDGVELRQMETDEQAARERFPGSPTILIDGEDVVPADGQPLTLTCRVYRLRDGRPSPVPDAEDVRAKVRDALGKET